MPITLIDTDKSYSPGELAALFGFINSDLDQTLTRWDFQNRRFANMGALGAALGAEIGAPVPLTRASVTADGVVERAVNDRVDIEVTLVRGTAADSATRAIAARSAGGAQRNPGCGRPTHQQAISQVGGSQAGQAQVKLPEFTALVSNSDKWALRGGWFFVRISTLYLQRGDVGQLGWVCFHAAPIEAGQFVPHPHPVDSKTPNAD